MTYNFDIDEDELIISVTYCNAITLVVEFDEDGAISNEENFGELHDDETENLIRGMCKKLAKFHFR